MKKKTVYTGGKKTPGLLFQGEMMTCRHCGRKKRSNPQVESNWTAIELDQLVIYVCPICWGKMNRGAL